MTGFMRTWHRHLGIWTAVIVLMLSITGILLIHKKELGLNKVMLGSASSGKPSAVEPWQMLLTSGRTTVVAAKQGIFIRDGEQWRQTLPLAARTLAEHDGLLHAGTRSGLFSSTDEGNTWHQVSQDDIRHILQTGKNTFLAVSTTAVWRHAGISGNWQRLAAFNKPLDVRSISIQDGRVTVIAKEGLFHLAGGKLHKEKLPPASGSEPLDLQKLITDLHNGKLGGTLLITIIDLTALILIFLTVSGIWIWWVPRRKRRAAALTQPAANVRSSV